tara:strand:- start:1048 stop:1449 length:402 start_codon:yes stop_codon:yes gene_type:complete
MTTIGEKNQEISDHYMKYIVGGQKGLITKAEYEQLVANYEANKGIENTTDFKPVVKLFNSWGSQTWLLSEIDEKGIFFGVCDMGQGQPELGYSHLPQMYHVLQHKLEKDRWFTASKTITEYANEARNRGYIDA